MSSGACQHGLLAGQHLLFWEVVHSDCDWDITLCLMGLQHDGLFTLQPQDIGGDDRKPVQGVWEQVSPQGRRLQPSPITTWLAQSLVLEGAPCQKIPKHGPLPLSHRKLAFPGFSTGNRPRPWIILSKCSTTELHPVSSHFSMWRQHLTKLPR